jgi:integrase/recombinase XerD
MTGTLRQAAAGYLQTRRSLGYQLQAHGRLLMSYIADLEATVTAANAVAWATCPAGASPVWHARRLSVARRFARYLSATDPSCQVPPAWLLPARYSRVAPYIYTQQQIDALVHAAGTLGSPLPAASCQAVISLLATTGMRIGEAIALTPVDADLDGGIITVVNGKHGASRHVPQACGSPSSPASLSPTPTSALART